MCFRDYESEDNEIHRLDVDAKANFILGDPKSSILPFLHRREWILEFIANTCLTICLADLFGCIVLSKTAAETQLNDPDIQHPLLISIRIEFRKNIS